MQRPRIDASGIGLQLSDRLQKQHGSDVEPVTFSVPVKEDLAARMLRVFQRGKLTIPNGYALLNDLHSVEKHVTAAGNVRYAAPRSEGSHADRFMALALALHADDSGFGEFAYAIAVCDDDSDSWDGDAYWTPCGTPFRRM